MAHGAQPTDKRPDMSIKRNSLLALTLLLTGCAAPKTAYYWGNYEPTVYQYFEQSSSPDEQVATLEKEIAKAKEKNQSIPPGMHAQLGMLYMQTGKESDAISQFQQEKTLFPESAHFLDFVMKLRSGQKQSNSMTQVADATPAQSSTQQTAIK